MAETMRERLHSWLHEVSHAPKHGSPVDSSKANTRKDPPLATREDFARDWLEGLGIPPYEGGLIALVNLMRDEGSQAQNNPDDTIQPEPGATPFNTFGNNLHVWNFPNYQEGVNAAVTTMQNGNNVEVLNALHARLGAPTVTAAIASASSWSSAGQLYESTIQDTMTNYRTYASVNVAGSQNAPAEGSPAEEAAETPTEEKTEDAETPQPAPTPPPTPAPSQDSAVPAADKATEEQADRVESAIEVQAEQVGNLLDHEHPKAAANVLPLLKTHLQELTILVQKLEADQP